MGKKFKFTPSKYTIERNTSYVRLQEDRDLPFENNDVPKSEEPNVNLLTALKITGLIALSLVVAGGIRYLFL